MAEKTVKYEYEYGLCKRSITGDCGVSLEGVPGHRKGRNWRACAVGWMCKDCEVMESADQVINPEWEWHMLDDVPGKTSG